MVQTNTTKAAAANEDGIDDTFIVVALVSFLISHQI
jgi:hypothetical protein